MIEIAPARSDEEALLYLEVCPRIWPGRTTLEGFRHWERTWDAYQAVALLDGEPAGVGWTGPVRDGFLSCGFGTVPELRGRGVGTALYRAISEHARADGKRGLTVEVLQGAPDALEWVRRRGFEEVEREEAVALDLTAHEPVPASPPRGVEIVTRADRPDLIQEMYEIALEASRDIPGLDGQTDQSFEDWAGFEIERPSRDPELCFIALAEGGVVGYASLDVFPDNVFHGLTAVARRWRGRGVATALKRSQIASAKARGFPRLVTESQHENEPMRRLNEKLGFRPEPSMSTIVLRGPLAPVD